MKEILYIGHTYHKKTKSSAFVVEMLKENNVITELYLDPDKLDDCPELKTIMGKHFNTLIVWQVMPDLDWLAKYVSWSHGMFFPMYDHYCLNLGLYDSIWRQYKNFIVVSFSWALHQELVSAGFDSRYLQYFPKPEDVEDWGDETSVFLWQRINLIDVNTLTKAVQNLNILKVHLHNALDPNQALLHPNSYWDETKAFLDKVCLTTSEWFENKGQLIEKINQSALYMAPRHYEGIGMSFLEAMALGRCVIAPDNPTMNEYIKDGYNGFLYPWDELGENCCGKSIEKPSLSIREIQKNALETIRVGYERWSKEKHQILNWLEEDGRLNEDKFHRCAIRCGWEEWPINKQPWPEEEDLKQHMQEIMPAVNTTNGPVDVSVITVVYNAIKGGRKETLLQCMESVQNQEGINIEHVIVDGASQDGTQQLITNFSPSRYPIRFISLRDSGIYEAMNRGIVLAKGKYLNFLNSDDFYHNPTGLKDSVAKITQTKCSYSFAPVSVLGESPLYNPHLDPCRYTDEIFVHTVFSHQSVVVSRQLMVDLHGYDLSYNSAADYDFILRMILEGHQGCYVNNSFVTFRMTGLSTINPRQSVYETSLILSRLYNQYLGSHLSLTDARRIHTTWSYTHKEKKLKKQHAILAKKAFVGLPEEFLQWNTCWPELKFIGRCLTRWDWKTLFHFFIVANNSRFVKGWYVKHYYKELSASGIAPAAHYLLYGWREGKDPSSKFLTQRYLKKNPDVARMDICPLVHWKLKGKREARKW